MKQPIPQLKAYLSELPDLAAREDFAKRCGTTLPYLRLVAGGHKEGSALLAINVDRESGGKVAAEVVAPDVDFAHLRNTPRPDPASDEGRAAA